MASKSTFILCSIYLLITMLAGRRRPTCHIQWQNRRPSRYHPALPSMADPYGPRGLSDEPLLELIGNKLDGGGHCRHHGWGGLGLGMLLLFLFFMVVL